MRKPELETERNLYPLWFLIDEASREVLKFYQREVYGLEIIIPNQITADNIPVDYGKFMSQTRRDFK